MTRFVVRRLVGLVPLLLVLSVAVFLLVYLIPGDPAVTLAGGEAATPERVAEVREQLGFDEPVVVQYGEWLADAVRLDFGESLYTGRPVGDELRDRLPVTASVVLGSVVSALLVGIPLGVLGGVRPARAKGLSPVRVVGKHAFKNAAMPAVTVLGLQIAYLFGGTVIIEQIFAIPGVGTYMVNAIVGQDVPIIQGGIMMLAVFVVLANLAVDLTYGFLNPKVRVS